MTGRSTFRAISIVAALTLLKTQALATPLDNDARAPHYTLVDEFTAATLGAGEAKIGFDLEYGITNRVMVGTDLIAGTLGAPNLALKTQVWEQGRDSVGVGLRTTYLDRNLILPKGFKNNFEKLEARILSPSIAWTRRLSDRLRLHTYWAVGIGRVRANLSEQGKKSLWEAKHPGGSYEMRRRNPTPEEAIDPSRGNQEERAEDASDTVSRRTLQLQAISGLGTSLFQITGEIERSPDKRILITSQTERTDLEQVRSESFRLTAAQQWLWEQFQFRLGIGLQYQVISGRDLDGERLDQIGILPASDINFYWRF